MKLGTKLAMTTGLMCVLVFGTGSVLAADAVCSQCGPGDHWTDLGTCAAGTDTISDQSALIGIDLDGDCATDTTLTLRTCGTDLVVSRDAPVGHDIATEIVDLCLTGGGITMIAGALLGQNSDLAASTGSIVETADPAVATSTFDVFFEIDLGGGNFVYNQSPLVVSADITCVPPVATYIHPTGCLDLWDAPSGGALVTANLVSARHIINKTSPDNPNIPTLSEWGVVVMTLVLLAAGTIVFGRIRARKVSAA